MLTLKGITTVVVKLKVTYFGFSLFMDECTNQEDLEFKIGVLLSYRKSASVVEL